MHDPAVFRSMHVARFHAEPAIFVAPGRVNLIGEHTDYAEGFVMPAAIDFATLAGISRAATARSRCTQKITARSGILRLRRCRQRPASTGPTIRWAWVGRAGRPKGHAIPAFSLSLWSDVPLGSGLSSSAALEVATALAVTSLIGVSYTRPALARLCQRSENEFVGANCWPSWTSSSPPRRKGSWLLLDCRDLTFKAGANSGQRSAGHSQYDGAACTCRR